MTDFLQLADKNILIFGLANKKSVAWHIAKSLIDVGASITYVVRNEELREGVARLTGDADVFTCDVGDDDQIEQLRQQLQATGKTFDGMVHSIAFADYEGGVKPFHESDRRQFLGAFDISCFSLIALSGAMKDLLAEDASVVTISISTTRMASENYGIMGPIKAALDSSLAFLAKSFSKFSRVRFNAVGASLLKTSASAGIPGYVDAYLYAEQVIPRGKALQTAEAANVALFLLSPRSSGINAQTVVADAGMSINYFDNEVIRKVMDSPE